MEYYSAIKKNSFESVQEGRSGSGKSPGGGNSLLGEYHGQRSLMGYSPWGCKKGDTTKSTLHVLTVFPRDIKLITGQLGLG